MLKEHSQKSHIKIDCVTYGKKNRFNFFFLFLIRIVYIHINLLSNGYIQSYVLLLAHQHHNRHVIVIGFRFKKKKRRNKTIFCHRKCRE